jgi:hypothetical protein
MPKISIYLLIRDLNTCTSGRWGCGKMGSKSIKSIRWTANSAIPALKAHFAEVAMPALKLRQTWLGYVGRAPADRPPDGFFKNIS